MPKFGKRTCQSIAVFVALLWGGFILWHVYSHFDKHNEGSHVHFTTNPDWSVDLVTTTAPVQAHIDSSENSFCIKFISGIGNIEIVSVDGDVLDENRYCSVQMPQQLGYISLHVLKFTVGPRAAVRFRLIVDDWVSGDHLLYPEGEELDVYFDSENADSLLSSERHPLLPNYLATCLLAFLGWGILSWMWAVTIFALGKQTMRNFYSS